MDDEFHDDEYYESSRGRFAVEYQQGSQQAENLNPYASSERQGRQIWTQVGQIWLAASLILYFAAFHEVAKAIGVGWLVAILVMALLGVNEHWIRGKRAEAWRRGFNQGWEQARRSERS